MTSPHLSKRILSGYVNNQKKKKNGQTWANERDLHYFMKLANEGHHHKLAGNVHVAM